MNIVLRTYTEPPNGFKIRKPLSTPKTTSRCPLLGRVQSDLLSAVQLEREVSFYCWPFAGDDAVNARVAKSAVLQPAVISQHAIELCAEALDRAAALMIEEVSAELHCNALQVLERVLQQQ